MIKEERVAHTAGPRAQAGQADRRRRQVGAQRAHTTVLISFHADGETTYRVLQEEEERLLEKAMRRLNTSKFVAVGDGRAGKASRTPLPARYRTFHGAKYRN